MSRCTRKENLMEVAEKVYEKAEARRVGKLPKKTSNYLLSGLLKCSACGASFTINSTLKRNQAFYICGSRSRRKDGCTNRLMIHQRELEQQITDWLKDTLLDQSLLAVSYTHLRAHET